MLFRSGGVKLSGITISRVEASYYGISGVSIGSLARDGSKSGFRNVIIRDSCVHHNAVVGVQVYGIFDINSSLYAHSNILITHVQSYLNPGRANLMDSHSGSGIMVSDTDGAVVRQCQAYNNGASNASPTSGPVGILAELAIATFTRGEYFFKERVAMLEIGKYIKNLPDARSDEDLLVDSRSVLRDIVAQHGLLTERATGIYSFSHLTFHEYFVACSIVNSSNPIDPLP